MADYYQILGIDKKASEEDIKKAYRKKAMEFHPDRNNGDKIAEQKFKEVVQAYEILSDTAKRNQYDQFGSVKSPPPSSKDSFSTNFSFDNIFEQFFGNRQQNNVPTKENLQMSLTITIEQAFCGDKKNFQYSVLRACRQCSAERKKNICKTCNGSGRIQQSLGFMALIERACGTCFGKGSTTSVNCSNCQSIGFKQENETLTVNIPKGSTTGSMVTLRGKGQEGVDGIGDLFVVFKVQNNENFTIENNNLYFNLKINVLELTVGKETTIELPDKTKISVIIPKGTQIDKEIRISGQGFSKGSTRGDLKIRLKPFVPQLDEEKLAYIRKGLE